jgi:hypothetical protein
MMRYFDFVVQRLIGWGAGAVTACGLAIGLGNQAIAQDALSLSIGGAPPFLELFLPEGTELVSGEFRGNTIDFFTPGYGVSDNVTFGPFNFSFFSDTETTSPTFTPLPGAITRTVSGENAGLALLFASDSDPTSPGGESDRFELDLITLGNPAQVLMSGVLRETIAGREFEMFNLPQIVITFDEGDGTISDILVVGPVMFDITSDSEIPLPATGNITITGESGTIFSITAVSDVPEPASMGILAAALAGLVITRLVTGRGPDRLLGTLGTHPVSPDTRSKPAFGSAAHQPRTLAIICSYHLRP